MMFDVDDDHESFMMMLSVKMTMIMIFFDDKRSPVGSPVMCLRSRHSPEWTLSCSPSDDHINDGNGDDGGYKKL